MDRVIAVDNASTDDTASVLSRAGVQHIVHNKKNLGCGVAWNQGALFFQSKWTIIMNNDVLVTPGWLEGLIDTGERHSLPLVSPAMIEGSDDYDVQNFAVMASTKAANALRIRSRHAVCMAIHESVWDNVGYFRSTPSLRGFEDTIFFHNLEKKNIRTAITGASWIHHFGSITLSAMKRERGLAQHQGLGDRKNYKLLGLSWYQRKLKKMHSIKLTKQYRQLEIAKYGFSLHGIKKPGVDISWE